MKNIQIAQLDEQDLKFVEALTKLGIKPLSGKIVIYLADVHGATQRDLVLHLDTQQSAVSTELNELIASGYVNTEAMPHEGKGRASIKYNLIFSIVLFILVN